MNEQNTTQIDFLVRGNLAAVDPDVAKLIDHEQQRQFAKLIMIASESAAPEAIREAEGSVLRNLYAEGYPHKGMHDQSEHEILDYESQMPYYRRNADRRYYKGVELCNIIEALAQRRGAEAFCPPGMDPSQLFLNVQPLSGAVANIAIYQALLQPGETVLALDLMHGGHLSHGSPVNITGMRQKIVNFKVSEEIELLDYEEIHELALQHKPKMIIAGFTSYPMAPDFEKFRAIANEVGAFLMADIAHTAGLCVAGYYPNPVGIADVTSFTTHKTLAGPRGAVIITTNPELADKIDRSMFPGMQGGAHFNKIAAMATMFKIAMTDSFKATQLQTVKNAVALAEGFKAEGLRVPHNGTNTHMVLLDTKSAATHNGEPLMGDVSSRILDLAGIVCNRNTIPGDKDASRPSALRFGTPWVTQRGLKEADMREIASVVASVLKSAKPFQLKLKAGTSPRARVNFEALLAGSVRIAVLAAKAGADAPRKPYTYPFVFDVPSTEPRTSPGAVQAIEIGGEKYKDFLDAVLSDRVSDLDAGDRLETGVLGRNRVPICPVSVVNTGTSFLLAIGADHAKLVTQWLRALSDNYVLWDDSDPAKGVPGPVTITEWGDFKG